MGLAAASALSEAHRREDALLRLRGASDAQLVQLAVVQGVIAGALGVAMGSRWRWRPRQAWSGTPCGGASHPET